MTKENFEKMLKFVLQREGGYVNNPNDLGGETNKGITHTTYDAYRKSKGLKTQSVKNITNEEIKEIYYNNYFKASGADRISDPVLSSYVFDTAVNMGVYRAKNILSQSNGDVDKFEQLRRDKYAEFVKAKPSQKVFLQGWNNRVTALKDFTQKNFPQNKTESSNEENKPAKFNLQVVKYEVSSKAINQRFNEEIRKKCEGLKNKKFQKIFGERKNSVNSTNSGNGHWVTINGNHIYLT